MFEHSLAGDIALPSIAQQLKAFGIKPSKTLGQNFLLDENLCHKIVAASKVSLHGQDVLEIGAGPGGLTRAILAQKPRQLVVIEKDRTCLPLLHQLQEVYPNLVVLEADALRMDLGVFGGRFHILSNMPYNIASPLLFAILELAQRLESATVMMQKEMADRILAGPGCKDYGRLTVNAQARCHARKCFDIRPSAFFPPPKVTSTVLHLHPHIGLCFCSKRLDDILRAAFSNRRKMISKSIPIHLLEQLGIAQQKRPEEVSVEQYIALASL